jgi:hypothetical protein
MYKFLKTLHPGGIRTLDHLFCRRTRWPLCHVVYKNLAWTEGHKVSLKNTCQISVHVCNWQGDQIWRIFDSWAIFNRVQFAYILVTFFTEKAMH